MRAFFDALRRKLAGNDIFISYSSKDRAQAELIEKLLRSGGYRVFRDDTALKTGDHLDRLLEEVRRSTMLMVLVTDNSVASDWVPREMETYCERPRKTWRIAPVFLDARYPAALPPEFAVLRDYKGVTGPFAGDFSLRQRLTSQFDAVRKKVLVRWAALATAIVLTLTIGGLVRAVRIATRTSELLKRAEAAKAAYRFDLAEAALAEAWHLDPKQSTLAAYRQARSHRALEQPERIGVGRGDTVVAVDTAGEHTYLVLQSETAPQLSVLRLGKRMPLSDQCAFPVIATYGQEIVWACGTRLSVAMANAPQPRSMVLLAEPRGILLSETRAVVLFRDGSLAEVAGFQIPQLAPMELVKLEDMPEGGEVGFCPATEGVWAFSAEDGDIVRRHWQPGSGIPGPVTPTVESHAVPNTQGSEPLAASWIEHVEAAPDCSRFFVRFAPLTINGITRFETARIRPGSPRPFDLFDRLALDVVPGSDESGVEAYYRTSNKEMRIFLLTSPVVLETQTRSLAAGVERISGWPGTGDRDARAIALGRDAVTVFRNQEKWSVYPMELGEPVRLLTSPDGALVAVQGDRGVTVWHRAEGNAAGSVPD
jgi:hypothetical protein